MCAGKTGGVSGEGFMNVELILYVIESEASFTSSDAIHNLLLNIALHT